jgi:hypothetical protein
MLHPLAIQEWDKINPEGLDGRSLIDQVGFYGVYIPSDKQWNKQIEVFKKRFNKPGETEFVKDVSRGLVNLHISISLCDTFKSLIELYINSEDRLEYETKLSTDIIESWDLLKPIVPSLYAISQRLLKYLDNLNVLISKNGSKAELPDFCYWDFVNKVEIAVNAFEHTFRDANFFRSRPFMWALCFDELEIAPDWLFEDLIKNHLRSRSQKILYKLTTIPVVSNGMEIPKGISDNASSVAGDDYEFIKMGIYNKESQDNWLFFCERYLQKVIRDKFGKPHSPKSFFGIQDYNSGLKTSNKAKFSKGYTTKNANEFSHGGIMWYVMKELADGDDRSFYTYLMRKGINPLDPIPINDLQIDSIHRKIKPIVLYRYYFNKKSGLKRSRKVKSLYHGTDFIYAFADGNPRAFVNLINDFLCEMSLNTSGEPRKIAINVQAKIIDDFSNNYFYPRIAYYSEGVVKYMGKTITLESMINTIGDYFSEQYTGGAFNPDPFSRILIDKDCHEAISILFNKGLESGGIVAIPPEKSKHSITTYRLSYSLHPHFKLPQRLYREKRLSEILKPLLDSADPQLKLKL